LKNTFLIRTDELKKQNHNDTFLKTNWENIIMANYEIDPAILIPFLPKGVELDLYGKTYMKVWWVYV
jgi:uncharacterized protein YqjF (DUF2071 family)